MVGVTRHILASCFFLSQSRSLSDGDHLNVLLSAMHFMGFFSKREQPRFPSMQRRKPRTTFQMTSEPFRSRAPRGSTRLDRNAHTQQKNCCDIQLFAFVESNRNAACFVAPSPRSRLQLVSARTPGVIRAEVGRSQYIRTVLRPRSTHRHAAIMPADILEGN